MSREHERTEDNQDTEEELAERTPPDHTEPAPETGKLPKRH